MKVAKRIVLIAWICFAGGLLCMGLLLLSIDKGVFGSLPNIYEIKNPSPQLATEIYSSDSVLLGKLYQKFDRINVNYNDISPYVIEALISTEDERFYKHSGIDFRSVLRALFSFGKEGGASTITQQLAKNIFTEHSERNIKRILQKLKEWIIAVKLEKNFSKEEILTLYLNTVPFGDNVYGIRNAAMTFFQKQASELKLEEAAMLVGLLKSNTTYNPRINPDAAFKRRNVVLFQMKKNGYILPKTYDSAAAIPIKIHYLKLSEKEGLGTYFREHIRNEVRKWINAYEKQTGKKYNMYQDGLRVFTTIHSKMQAYLEQSAQNHLSKMQRIFDRQIAPIEGAYWKSLDSLVRMWKKNTHRYKDLKSQDMSDEEIDKIFVKKIPMSVFSLTQNRFVDTLMSPLDSLKHYKKMLQVGALFVDPNEGKILAWVGGVNYKAFQYDHVKTAKRQVGSTIKPLLYSLAMESYGFTPQTLCSNMPQCFPSANNTIWCSRNNFGSRKDSIASFTEGIVFSLNNISAFVIRQLSPQAFADFLQNNLMIQSKIHPYASLALGTSDFSLYEMVRAYTVFPTNGIITDFQTITRIEDKEGRALQYFPAPKHNIALSEKTAYSMAEIMRGTATYGTASRLKNVYDLRGEISGKTGTTNDYSDAWFIGFTNNILGGVWVGCEDKIISFQSKEGEGSSMALPIFGEFMVRYMKNAKQFGAPAEPTFNPPLGVDDKELKKYINNVSRLGALKLAEQESRADSSVPLPSVFVLSYPPDGSAKKDKKTESTKKETSIFKNDEIERLIEKDKKIDKKPKTKDKKVL